MNKTLVLVLGLAGCAGRLIPPDAVAELGNQMYSLGHPNATCGAGTLAGRSHGPLSFLRPPAERWIDIAVPYTRKGASHQMTIRVNVHSLQPCSVTTNVIADDGPTPILLDNPLSSKLVGDAICEELASASEGAR